MRQQKKIWIAALTAACVWWIGYSFYQLPDKTDIPGGFSQTAFVRNENNLGTVVLLYAFSVKDTTRADYLAYGNTLSYHTYSGTTTAYFFAAENMAPAQLQLNSPHFDTARYKPVALYHKNVSGAATVVRQPR